MTELNLTGPREHSATIPAEPIPASPQERKNPGVAFLLSLFLPGLGQAYCGKNQRGALTFLFALGGGVLAFFFLTDTDPKGELLGGLGLRVALVLYLFSFLDAYFTAREINAGRDAVQPYNPRIAAVLNLLTRGFGYWYVDERSKGVTLFVVVGVAERIAQKMEDPGGIWLGLAIELALAFMAADAFRIAKQENALAVAAPPVTPEGIQPEEGMKPGLPLALASLFVAAYFGLIVLAALLPDYERIDQSRATIAETADGKVYRNPKYGVELHVPAGWDLDHQSDPELLVQADAQEGGCSILLLPDSVLPFATTESLARKIVEEVQRDNPGLEVRESRATQLAQRQAYEVVTRQELEGFSTDQAIVIAKDGLTVYLLIASMAGPSDDPCRADIAKIRQRLVLPN